MLYIPLLIVISALYGPDIVILLGLLVPLIEIRHFKAGPLGEEVSFSVAAVLSALLASLIFTRMREDRDRIKKHFDSLKEEAEFIDVNTPAGIISSEGLVSQHLSITNEATADIREILLLAKHFLSADSVSVFLLRDNSLELRCSSEASQHEDIPRENLIASCIRKRQLVAFNSMGSEKNAPLSYIAAPLVDGNFAYGMLTARGSRPFVEAEGNIIEMFARQVAKLFKR
ncbi:MAG TPA: GAF domain-containing protein, partial [Thermodesulfovibrionales bacterium]|nr:GAF domain-containing protein [Thermodesulfovibrionales bacterium]